MLKQTLLGLGLALHLMSTTVEAAGNFPQAAQLERARQRTEAAKILTIKNYDLSQHPLTDSTHWRRILWSVVLTQPTDAAAQRVIGVLLDAAAVSNVAPSLLPTLQAALRTAAALYLRPVQLETRVAYAFVPDKLQTILLTNQDPALVAMALMILHRDGRELTGWVQQVKERMPLWSLNLQLRTTIEAIEQPLLPLPPLQDLLQHQLAAVPQLYVFCRPDRSIPCLTLLKDSQGQFYREHAALWQMLLLGRSIYPVDWNFNSGQTPQGLMRIEGTIARTPEEFRAFGQFPSFKIFLPNETGASQFIPGLAGTMPIDEGLYRNLWPASWQTYPAIAQSYWAGKIGRSLIRIHGSGENPEFFYAQPVALPNPTIGCLGALEHYTTDGQLEQAELPRLLAAWQAVQPGDLKTATGYLWLVDVPDQLTSGQPVSISEIEPLLSSAP